MKPLNDAVSPTFPEALKVWTRVALLSFGGPAGQIAVMHRILVQEKRWLSEERFSHALSFCMLLPGPEAHQLATYIGWLLNGVRGGLVAGMFFIIPGIITIMLLSWIYALYGEVGMVAALFFGLKCAVLAIVIQAMIKIGGRAVRNGLGVIVAIAAFVAIFFFNVPFPLIILCAALAGVLAFRAGLLETGPAARAAVQTRPPGRALLSAGVFAFAWLAPLAALWVVLGADNTYTQIASFFSRMAVVTFGGAYAVLAYMGQQAVEHYGWLAAGEMLDGLGMAEPMPGPLIKVVQFVGFMGAWRDPGMLPPLVGGSLGGLLATWVTFTPSFLWIFLFGPWVERLRGNARIAAALQTITAAVAGIVANLALWFALNVIFTESRRVTGFGLDFQWPLAASVEPWALALTVLAVVAAVVLRVGLFTVIFGGLVAGLLLHVGGLV